jgi:hypothetical protein
MLIVIVFKIIYQYVIALDYELSAIIAHIYIYIYIYIYKIFRISYWKLYCAFDKQIEFICTEWLFTK